MNNTKIVLFSIGLIITLLALATIFVDLQNTNVRIQHNNNESETFVFSHKTGIEPYRITFIDEDYKHVYFMPECESLSKSAIGKDEIEINTSLTMVPIFSLRIQWEMVTKTDKPALPLSERFKQLKHCLITEPKQIGLLDYLWITL